MIVSFDFDSTIALSEWDKEENDYVRDERGDQIQHLNPKIAAKIKEHKVNGDTVYVLTTRYAIWREDTQKFLEDNNLWGYIDDLIFTNGAWKANKAKKLGIKKHYDDDSEELRRLKYKGIEGVMVHDDHAASMEKLNQRGGGWQW